MGQAGALPLASWATFYEIAGSAAGALTGLQFLMITLLAQRKVGSMREVRAFGTPTIVHFCVALLIAATMSAPWRSLSDLGICVGVYGALGIGYSLRVLFHARAADYRPDAEDWLWYTAIPLLGYAALLGAAILFWYQPVWSAVIIAATDFVFLFVGVHNAWDTVTYLAVEENGQKQE